MRIFFYCNTTIWCIIFLVVLTLDSCLERIDIGSATVDTKQIVVDAFLSDEPGPHYVKLKHVSTTYDNLLNAPPFSAQKVIITDDLGKVEELTEVELGLYLTDTLFRGHVGRTYTLHIEARDGSIYESTPETMQPPGVVDSLYYAFEKFQPATAPAKYGFRVYMDAHGSSEEENLLRWQFTGVYKVRASPEAHTGGSLANPIPDPLPCCSFCWVYQYEDKPLVSDGQIAVRGKFKNIEVGYVPITGRTFYEKFLVEVKQMSLTRNAFEYFKIVENQHSGAGSLFQPPLGVPRTNISQINGDKKVEGLFYVASVASKHIFLTRKEVEKYMPVPIADPYNASCLDFLNSTTQQPADWK